MIIVDLNQVMLSNLLKQISPRNPDVSEDLIRHMVLNSLRMYKQKFGEKYGELVICADDRKYWRREVFPYYKSNRKKERAQSSLDWNLIFDTLNRIKQEIKDNFPYKVIQVHRAEADDIIGTLCKRFGHLGIAPASAEPILILSSDKDFGQLQKYANVDQYSPVGKQFIRIPNPDRFLKEHIIKGDRGDGIPNFLSDDDTFASGGRQKPIKSANFVDWSDMAPEDFCTEKMLAGYMRNKQLIDLDCIPQDVQDAINEEFDTVDVHYGNLLNYFIKHKLKNLTEHIGEF